MQKNNGTDFGKRYHGLPFWTRYGKFGWKMGWFIIHIHRTVCELSSDILPYLIQTTRIARAQRKSDICNLHTLALMLVGRVYYWIVESMTFVIDFYSRKEVYHCVLEKQDFCDWFIFWEASNTPKVGWESFTNLNDLDAWKAICVHIYHSRCILCIF